MISNSGTVPGLKMVQMCLQLIIVLERNSTCIVNKTIVYKYRLISQFCVPQNCDSRSSKSYKYHELEQFCCMFHYGLYSPSIRVVVSLDNSQFETGFQLSMQTNLARVYQGRTGKPRV